MNKIKRKKKKKEEEEGKNEKFTEIEREGKYSCTSLWYKREKEEERIAGRIDRKEI